MEYSDHLTRLLEACEPQQPVDRLVENLNRLYHLHEAGTYDDRHPEIRRQLPEIWASMIEFATSPQTTGPWDVLDFGCGTGFASEQLLSHLPADKLRSLTCFDPSPEMLERGRESLSEIIPCARFTSRFEDITAAPNQFHVLITNSVLHHLADPLQTIKSLTPKLADNAIWLCGHEPSIRFYQNKTCVNLYQAYERWHRWRRYLAPKAYLRRIGRSLGLTHDPASRAAVAAHQLGLFRRRPPRHLVSQLVDFHVARSPLEVDAGRGFDVGQLQHGLRDDWSLEWHQTYNFLGPVWEGNAGAVWQSRCQRLKAEFPEDGANFCSVWKRNTSSDHIGAQSLRKA